MLASSSATRGQTRAVPVLIIGILVFLPGFYHLRIAYYASKGRDTPMMTFQTLMTSTHPSPEEKSHRWN